MVGVGIGVRWLQTPRPAGKLETIGAYDMPADLGCERDGIRFVWAPPYPTLSSQESDMRLVALRGNKRTTIHGPADIRGLVDITSSKAALRYVRLWTSIGGLGAWDRSQLETGVESTSVNEVMPYSEFLRRPDFVVTRFDLDETAQFKSFARLYVPSGCDVVLSDSAFKKGKFTPPKVTQQGSEFIVERWLFYETGRISAVQSGDLYIREVRFVRETVSSDGDYHCVVLKRKPAPDLPGTNWDVGIVFWWQRYGLPKSP